MAEDRQSRRRFLATAVAVSAVGLSGCGSGGNATTTEGGGGTPIDTPEATPTPEPADTPEATPTPEPADTPTPTPGQATMTNWESYQVNSGNWGHKPDATGPGGSPSKQWVIDLNENEVNSAPILVDGTLYVGGGGPGDSVGTFYAIDAKSGDVQWSKELDAPITGGAAYADTTYGELVIVGTGSGLIKAYKPNGTQFWDFEIQSNERLTPPVVGDSAVYFGTNGGRFFKFNLVDGTKKWTFKLTGEVKAAPAFADGTAVISSANDNVIGVSSSGGTEEWSYSFDEDANGVAIRDGAIYATSTDGSIVSLNAAGRRNWTGRGGSEVLSPPAVSDTTVFAGTVDNRLVALDRSSGNEAWRFEKPSSSVSAPPVVADGTVYFGCQDSRVYAVDAASGEMQWSRGTGNSIDNAAPVVSGGMVFIGSDDGKMYALG